MKDLILKYVQSKLNIGLNLDYWDDDDITTMEHKCIIVASDHRIINTTVRTKSDLFCMDLIDILKECRKEEILKILE